MRYRCPNCSTTSKRIAECRRCGSAMSSESTMLQARQRMNRLNKDRKARLYARNFGGDVPGHDKASWIRGLASCVSGERDGLVAHHVRSRGAGGSAADLVPVTHAEHQELHQIGAESFEARYSVDLAERAAYYEDVWRSHVEGWEPDVALVTCGACGGSGRIGASLEECGRCRGFGAMTFDLEEAG